MATIGAIAFATFSISYVPRVGFTRDQGYRKQVVQEEKDILSKTFSFDNPFEDLNKMLF